MPGAQRASTGEELNKPGREVLDGVGRPHSCSDVCELDPKGQVGREEGKDIADGGNGMKGQGGSEDSWRWVTRQVGRDKGDDEGAGGLWKKEPKGCMVWP